jgi:hypothetical protein
LNYRLDRSPNGVHVEEAVEALVARRPVAPVVHAERDVESLDLLIDRPEGLGAEVLFHPLGRDRDPGQA